MLGAKRPLLAFATQKKTKVILGTINVSSSRVETVEEMRTRLTEALEYTDADRLVVAPDCGPALLDGQHRPLLNVKLANMCKAAKCVPCTSKRLGISTKSGT